MVGYWEYKFQEDHSKDCKGVSLKDLNLTGLSEDNTSDDDSFSSDEEISKEEYLKQYQSLTELYKDEDIDTLESDSSLSLNGVSLRDLNLTGLSEDNTSDDDSFVSDEEISGEEFLEQYQDGSEESGREENSKDDSSSAIDLENSKTIEALSKEDNSLEEEAECPKCRKNFFNLSVHLRVSHSSDRLKIPSVVRCLMCGILLRDPHHLIQHLMDHRAKTKQCCVCLREFSGVQSLLEHLEHHKQLHVYLCWLCDDTFATRMAFLRHRELCGVVVDKKYKKLRYDTEFLERRRKSTRHLDRLDHPPDSTHQTDSYLVNQGSERGVYKDEHGREDRSEVSPLIKTEESNPLSSTDIGEEPKRARKPPHQKGVLKSDAKSFKCKYCDKVYKTRRGATYHVRRVHEGCKYQCPKCEGNFPAKYLLDEHSRKHSGLTEVCPLCNKSFSDSSALAQHSLAHKPQYQCHYCSSRFSRKCLVVGHTKRKECTLCDHVAPCVKLYADHLSSYHGERLFKCDKCDKCFHVEGLLNWHKVTRHRKRSKDVFSCESCGHLTNSRKNLLRHQRRNYKCSKKFKTEKTDPPTL